MSAIAEIGRVRRQQIVNLSITELMILLVFMAVTFSFLAKEEGLIELPLLQKEMLELREQNASLIRQIAALSEERGRLQGELQSARAEITRLQRILDQIMNTAEGVEPNPPPEASVLIGKAKLAQLVADLEALRKENADLRRRNADLNKQLGDTRNELSKALGGKAPGLPRCSVSGTYLFTISLKAGGFYEVAYSSELTSVELARLPGAGQLATGRPLTGTEFIRGAAELNKGADSSEQPCRYAVRVKRDHSTLDLFERQLSTVESYFYVRRGR